MIPYDVASLQFVGLELQDLAPDLALEQQTAELFGPDELCVDAAAEGE